MKTRINLYASLLAISVLTGCSSSPVYESESNTTDIDNAVVKTAEVESADIEVVPVVADTATVFYFDFEPLTKTEFLLYLRQTLRLNQLVFTDSKFWTF